MNIAGLCKGSTADSDSVCEGSNPSPAAISAEESKMVLLRGNKFIGFYARVVELADSIDSGSSVQYARAGSSPASRTSSSQAICRLRRAFSFHCKAHRALILLLLASKPNPLRWASVWGRRFAAVLSDLEKISILTAPSKRTRRRSCPFLVDAAGRLPYGPRRGISDH